MVLQPHFSNHDHECERLKFLAAKQGVLCEFPAQSAHFPGFVYLDGVAFTLSPIFQPIPGFAYLGGSGMCYHRIAGGNLVGLDRNKDFGSNLLEIMDKMLKQHLLWKQSLLHKATDDTLIEAREFQAEMLFKAHKFPQPVESANGWERATNCLAQTVFLSGHPASTKVTFIVEFLPYSAKPVNQKVI